MKKKLFKLFLMKSYLLSPNNLHLILKGNFINFLSGQFITLHVVDDKGKKYFRNYSIANSPNKKNIIELSISRIKNGLATGILFNLRKGDVIYASGPIGKFLLNHEEKIKRYILLATGTGVATYRSMLDNISKLIIKSNVKFILVMGCRKRSDCIYFHDFLKFQKKYGNFKYFVFFSKEKNRKNIFENIGYIQNSFPFINLNHKSDIVFLCGNPSMIDDGIVELKKFKFNNKSIKKEKYIISK